MIGFPSRAPPRVVGPGNRCVWMVAERLTAGLGWPSPFVGSAKLLQFLAYWLELTGRRISRRFCIIPPQLISNFFLSPFLIALHLPTAFPKDLPHQAHSCQEAEAKPPPSPVDPPPYRQHRQVQRQAQTLAPYQARHLSWMFVALSCFVVYSGNIATMARKANI